MIQNLPANAGRPKRLRFDPWVGKISLEEGTATDSLLWRLTRELWGMMEMPCFLWGGSYTLSEFLRLYQIDNLYCL